MSTAISALRPPAKTPGSGSPALLLQRKCACGSASGVRGECEECHSKRLLGKPLQAKLRIGAASDEYEQEADRVAEHVMRMRDSSTNMQPMPLSSKPLVQRRVSSAASSSATVPTIVHEVLSSAGQPLGAAQRAYFEPRFGHDFSQVRIHAGDQAARSAQAVRAHAYTAGNHIVVAEGARLDGALLAHELAHVVQQEQAPAVSRLQRAPSSEQQEQGVDVGSEAAPRGMQFTELARRYPAFARELAAFSQRFWDLFELTRGPLMLSGILDAEYFIPARKQYLDALNAVRRREAYLRDNSRYLPRDIYNWMQDVATVLGAVAPLMRMAEPEVSDDATETQAIAQVRQQLPQLRATLARLEQAGIIQLEKQKQQAERQAARDRAEQAAAHYQTPEGRRDIAVAYLADYVRKHWSRDLDQASADVHAIALGRYLIHEQQFDGQAIQSVLEALFAADRELYDRAMFGGRLLVYLLAEGITGLQLQRLLSGSEEGAEGEQQYHISGAGLYAGFELTWLDLMQRRPISAPQFSFPTPRDFVAFELGFDYGVVAGFGGALQDAFWDAVASLNPMSYVELYRLLTKQLEDARWRFQVGQGMAHSLHAYLQDVADDSVYETGKKFGSVAGFVLAQLLLTWIGAKVATLATSLLRATKWGKPLVEFAEKVADALPWNEPRVVQDDLPTTGAAQRELPGGLADESVDIETSVARSSHRESAELTAREKLQEAAWVDQHPEVVSGAPPHRQADLGEHSIVEEGLSKCVRHSTEGFSVPCPVSWTITRTTAPQLDPLWSEAHGPILDVPRNFVPMRRRPRMQATLPRADVLHNPVAEAALADLGHADVELAPQMRVGNLPSPNGEVPTLMNPDQLASGNTTPNTLLEPTGHYPFTPAPEQTLNVGATSRLHRRNPARTYPDQAREMVEEALRSTGRLRPRELGPDAPGANQHAIYFFYDQHGQLLKVGQTLDLHDRIYTNLTSALRDGPQIPSQVRFAVEGLNDAEADALEWAFGTHFNLAHEVPPVPQDAQAWAMRFVQRLDRDQSQLRRLRRVEIPLGDDFQAKADWLYNQASSLGALFRRHRLPANGPTASRYALYVYYDRSGRPLRVGITTDVVDRTATHISSTTRISRPFHELEPPDPTVIAEGVHLQIVSTDLNSVQALYLEQALGRRLEVIGRFKVPVSEAWENWAESVVDAFIARGGIPIWPGAAP